MKLVYVNDSLIDLFPDTKFQITIPSFKIGDLKTRSVKYTSSIKVPNSNNNQEILGISTLSSLSTKPYSNFEIKIIDDGIEVFKGKCFVSEMDNGYTLSGIGSEFDIFDALKNTYVSDVETVSSGVLEDATYYTYRNGLSNIYCPVMNSGKFTNLPPTLIPNGSFVDTDTEFWVDDATKLFNLTINNWDTSVSGQISCVIPAGEGTYLRLCASAIFYPGFLYQIVTNLTLSANVSTDVNLYSFYEDGTVFLIGSTNYTTLGSKTINSSVSDVKKLIGIGIMAKNNGVLPQTIVVTDITRQVDTAVSITIDDPFYMPSFGYRSAISQSLAQTFIGSVDYGLTTAQTDELNSWIINSVRDNAEYSKRFIEKRSILANGDGTQVVNFTTTAKANVTFPTIVKTDFGSWPNTYTYRVPNIGYQYYADVKFDIILNVTNLSGGAVGSIDIVVGATTYTTSSQFSATGRTSLTINTADTEPKGNLMDNIDIVCSVINTTVLGNITATIESAIITITPIPYPQDEAVLLSAYILPDVTTYELLKDYVVRTGSLVKFDGISNTLYLKPIENVINDKASACDWTQKRVNVNDKISFDLSGYSQVNWFQDKDYQTNSVSRDSIDLSNENIRSEQIFYESFFDTCIDQPVKKISIANTGVFNFESERVYEESYSSSDGVKREYKFSLNSKTSLLKTRSELVTDPIVNYGVTTASDYTVANYVKWSDIITMFYTGLQSSINQTKVIERIYNLSLVDIYNFDTFKLIFDTDSYFLVLEIKYQSGELSKVKLLKVF